MASFPFQNEQLEKYSCANNGVLDSDGSLCLIDTLVHDSLQDV